MLLKCLLLPFASPSSHSYSSHNNSTLLLNDFDTHSFLFLSLFHSRPQTHTTTYAIRLLGHRSLLSYPALSLSLDPNLSYHTHTHTPFPNTLLHPTNTDLILHTPPPVVTFFQSFLHPATHISTPSSLLKYLLLLLSHSIDFSPITVGTRSSVLSHSLTLHLPLLGHSLVA